eukprot:PITA_31122
MPKKDRTWKKCIYYRALNKITLKNRYPLPKINDLLDQLQQEKYFTKLDLKSGYHHVQVKEEDTWMIAFKSRRDSFVIVYLDDILVYSATWEEHISHLMQVLETLKKHQLLANLKKCEFVQQSLVYLGYVISGGELKIYASKMEVVMKWLMPTNVYEVMHFIVATQYLRKFIASFSAIAASLHAITTSGKSFQWGKGKHKAFKELKEKISETPVPTLLNLQ